MQYVYLGIFIFTYEGENLYYEETFYVVKLDELWKLFPKIHN